MEYLPIQEYSDKWNISKRRIQVLCKEGRISGAKMIGNMWVIPENADRPNDARIKNPVIENISSPSMVRKDLKKFLKKIYDRCSERNIPIKFRKDYVLSIIAGELFLFYLDREEDENILNIVYQDVSLNRGITAYDKEDRELVAQFIIKHKLDVEIDNILSWAYQYSNKFIKDNVFRQTQFFTEKYMIRYLIENIPNRKDAKKVLDPCVGGGNFLVEYLEELCNTEDTITKEQVLENCKMLYGFDIDNKIAQIAVINIKLRVLAILKRKSIDVNMDVWNEILPNIYMSIDGEKIQGSLTKENKKIINVITQKGMYANELFSDVDIVLTNPPFASIKGMRQEQKEFLKSNYPNSNCDTCVAFMEAIGKMLNKNGVCGIVSQSSWMHLKSFNEIRKWVVNNYKLDTIVNLGTGAFRDLSGEKSNVALLIFSKNLQTDNIIKILNVKANKYEEKVEFVKSENGYIYKAQEEINGNNGFDFTENGLFEELDGQTEFYKDIGVPMQGTSTGNAKELVGYFWEHFGDSEWISVSNGGGYCRWQGLNNSVVKWGDDGKYIKEQKGSALRNVKYFSETQMVFSDTGTAGLNVRLLRDNQIFIASGPGIRVKKGNKYAHMALLNSRLASYCIRLMSPKLTIAAGYIGQIPVNEAVSSSVVLEKDAKLCIELKNKMLSIRTNNIEYNDAYLVELPKDLNKAAWTLFNEDITNELMKLELECKIDNCLFEYYGFSEKAKDVLDDSVGKCAYEIKGSEDIDLLKLDRYLDRILDGNCCLKRTKNAKNALGSDGYLEYLSKDLNVNPETIVHKIQENPYEFERVLKKYKNLILHNYALYCLGYNTHSGAARNSKCVSEIVISFLKQFEGYDYENWIKNTFNEIHADIFKGIPYMIYDKGAIHINDRFVTG